MITAGTHQNVSQCFTRECGRVRPTFQVAFNPPPFAGAGGPVVVSEISITVTPLARHLEGIRRVVWMKGALENQRNRAQALDAGGASGPGLRCI